MSNTFTLSPIKLILIKQKSRESDKNSTEATISKNAPQKQFPEDNTNDEEDTVSSSSKEITILMKSDKEAAETDDGLQCETCMIWYIKCQDVRQKKYKILISKDGNGLLWFCNMCERTALGLIKNIMHLGEKIKLLEGVMKTHKAAIEIKIQDKEAKMNSNKDDKVLEDIKLSLEKDTETTGLLVQHYQISRSQAWRRIRKEEWFGSERK